MRRIVILVSVVALCGSAAAAQGPTSVPHHDAHAPDYITGIAATALAGIRMPAPPEVAPSFASLHHRGDIPDYSEVLRPPQPPHITLPPPPPGEAPAVVRGLYVNAWGFGSNRFYDLVRLADTTEVNALVIDVKDATGHITYRSAVATAIAIGANGMTRAPDARDRLALLHERGIHPIARIVVARDPLLARGKPNWAVTDVNGGLWIDGLGDAWVDAYNDSVWIYAADVAAEAVLLGFREIQFDYVRFPDEPRHRLSRAVFSARRNDESKRAAVQRQVTLLKERIEQLGVPFTLDVFGLTTSATGDMGIGQNWDDLSALAHVMLPMVYPSHYARGAYGFGFPNAEPYGVVRRALEDALARRRPGYASIRPFLQAFSIRGVRYTGQHVRAQIDAVEDLGLTDWILWNARGVYPADAFRPSRPAPSIATDGVSPGSSR